MFHSEATTPTVTSACVEFSFYARPEGIVMLDMLIHKWWLWLGRVLVAVSLWYGYEGLEVDSRHADALEMADKRVLEIDQEIENVENELQNAEFLVQRVRISAKLVKLHKEKSQFLDESMRRSVKFYIERLNTILNFLIFLVAAFLVWSVVPRLQKRWLRWRNRRRLLAATREEEAPIDKGLPDTAGLS